jgi:hypothetical protein
VSGAVLACLALLAAVCAPAAHADSRADTDDGYASAGTAVVRVALPSPVATVFYRAPDFAAKQPDGDDHGLDHHSPVGHHHPVAGRAVHATTAPGMLTQSGSTARTCPLRPAPAARSAARRAAASRAPPRAG